MKTNKEKTNMRKVVMTALRSLFIIAATLVATSCADDTAGGNAAGGDGSEGRKAVLSLKMSAVPETAGMTDTRSIPDGTDINEGTANDYEITDFWLMEYNEKGLLIGSPRYYLMSKLKENAGGGDLTLPVVLPTTDGTKYKCVVIANTHTPALDAALGDAMNTLDKLKTACKNVLKDDDMYQQTADEDRYDMLLNGTVDIDKTTQTLDFKLYRNVAKLTLKITNNTGSGITVKSVQMRGVTASLFYADRLYDGDPAPSPTALEAGQTDLDAEECEIKAGGETMTLNYYLTRNRRGVTNATLPSQKNTDAPDGATYVEIIAATDDGAPLRYRFYIGANMTNDFNVEPNKHYTLPITFTAKGDPEADSRVEEFGTEHLVESNAYIINPLSGTDDLQPLYEVPITRINKFWSSGDGVDQAGKDYTIKANTEWVAEVIWQDKPERLFNFCSADGKISEGNTRFDGKGVSFFYIKPVAGASGNVLIGVRKKEDKNTEYLWSWHLWITDYNPEYTRAWQTGKYTYEVEGGHVNRYEGDIWESKYKDKYIMDRNLGATSADPQKGFDATCGLVYQYGRKDPFPISNVFYDINGNEIKPTPKNVVTDKAYIYASVNSPATFFGYATGNWVKDNLYSGNIWNNPNWNKSSTKSLFDPCPPGWTIPETEIFKVLFKVYSMAGAGTEPNVNGGFNSGWDFYMNSAGTGETTWFPAAGYVHGNQLVRVKESGYLWGRESGNIDNCYTTAFNSTKIYKQVQPRRFAYSIRCIQIQE